MHIAIAQPCQDGTFPYMAKSRKPQRPASRPKRPKLTQRRSDLVPARVGGLEERIRVFQERAAREADLFEPEGLPPFESLEMQQIECVLRPMEPRVYATPRGLPLRGA